MILLRVLPLIVCLLWEQTSDQRRLNIESFENVWTTIRDKHWDTKPGGLDWQAIHDEFRPQIELATSASQARSIMATMLSRLGQSHFNIFPNSIYKDVAPAPKPEENSRQTNAEALKPSGEAKAKQRTTESVISSSDDSDKRTTRSRAGNEAFEDGTPGFNVGFIEGEAMVTSVDQGSPASTKEVRLGWQLLKIDGKDLAPIFKQVAETIKDPATKEDMMTGAVLARLAGPVEESVRIEFLEGENKKIEMEIPRARRRGTRVRFGNLPTQDVWFESRKINGAGYIAFNLFLDPANLMLSFEKAVRSFMQADGIIIDLRGNRGGIGPMAMGMAGWFIDRPDQRLGIMHTRETSLKFVVTPRLETYQGPLAILVDGGSYSTSEIFAGGMKDLGRARIFGTRTPGVALPSLVEELPNGDRFQYAVANYISEGGKPLEGNGVIPDVKVRLTREALRRGRDPVIEAALDWIRAQKKR